MSGNLNLKRTAARREAAQEFSLEPLPELPISLRNRFPDLAIWVREVRDRDERNGARLRAILTNLKGE